MARRAIRKGSPMNLATSLEASAFFFPDNPAVRQGNLVTTYAQLNEQANRIATGLMKMGVAPGQHVGLCALNSADWIAFYFGVLKAGAVAVTLPSTLTENELSILVAHSKPGVMFTTDAKLQELLLLRHSAGLEKIICPGGDLDLNRLMKMGSGSFKALDRDRDDTAAILYTGGTTGTPKGVMLTHECIQGSSHSVAHCERSTESDVALCFLPFNHVFGQMHIMNATILSSGCLELLPSFDMEKVLEAMQSGRLTKFFAVPTVYMRLLTLGDLENRVGRLRYCFSAAASMPVEIVRQWKARTGISISEGYGMTEAMPVSYNHYHRHVIGSVGQPVDGVEVQIRDASGKPLERGHQGEICVRGRMVMKGYLNDPEGTRSAFWDGGWYRSGDVGLFDSDDYLFIVDRLKDMIITGGENVYSREVEEVLYTRQEIQECAVIGLPDKEWGERVAAVIVPKPGMRIVPEDLKSLLKAHLSGFKVPKEFLMIEEMPKNPAGKILKRELKKRFVRGDQ
jgi:long-chain acyl-CoA synthetase